MKANAVLDYLKACRKKHLDTLIRYASFPSISAQSSHAGNMRACSDWLRNHCESIGLSARLVETPGHPVVMATTRRISRSGSAKDRPHFVLYGHYDVQPPEPLELWKSDPFKPTVRQGALFARGASDNKGQHLAHLNAIEAYLRTGTPLPCDVTFLIEGEEEVGSDHLPKVVRKHRRELACDAMVISDTGMPSRECPALTYSLRGLAALEIHVQGPDRDLHSGLYGGAVNNPAMALAQVLAQVRDARGRIVIPGFYDGVRPLTAVERGHARRLPHSPEAIRKMLGVPALFGEQGYTEYEQRTARPTFEINGLTSGYQGEGSKTIIPSWASAKITMRLVPGQNPAKIKEAACRYLQSICPPSVRLTLKKGHDGEPYWVDPTGPTSAACLRALEKAFGKPPVLLREGGSIPIVNTFSRELGVDVLLLGLALPDDNLHSPNEKFDLENYYRGSVLSAELWPELAISTKG